VLIVEVGPVPILFVAEILTRTNVPNDNEYVDVKVLIGTIQYRFEITTALEPSQSVVVAQVDDESYISIVYEVIASPLSPGAVHNILTPPVAASIEVVTPVT
jgi:hypothetical protein